MAAPKAGQVEHFPSYSDVASVTVTEAVVMVVRVASAAVTATSEHHQVSAAVPNAASSRRDSALGASPPLVPTLGEICHPSIAWMWMVAPCIVITEAFAAMAAMAVVA